MYSVVVYSDLYSKNIHGVFKSEFAEYGDGGYGCGEREISLRIHDVFELVFACI